jgi:hypothetical protein
MEEKLVSPCTPDCPDRKGGCAITCPKWQKYTVERQKIYDKRKQDCLVKYPRKRGRYDRD